MPIYKLCKILCAPKKISQANLSLSTFNLTNTKHLIPGLGLTTKEFRKACLKHSFARELR